MGYWKVYEFRKRAKIISSTNSAPLEPRESVWSYKLWLSPYKSIHLLQNLLWQLCEVRDIEPMYLSESPWVGVNPTLCIFCFSWNNSVLADFLLLSRFSTHLPAFSTLLPSPFNGHSKHCQFIFVTIYSLLFLLFPPKFRCSEYIYCG